MNYQQLEYIIAVDNFRHFARAADACFVTQPTLSMMIQKLEDELGAQIFDRTRLPVRPTTIGEKIIAQARIALDSARHIKSIVDEEKALVEGTLKLGIIPTIAPYFMPLFLHGFTTLYPRLQLNISEMMTAQVIQNLASGQLDAAILATPLGDENLIEHVLYYEQFYAYISEKENGFAKKELGIDDIGPDRLWLLEEGHCFRSQILRYCDIRKKQNENDAGHFIYEAGSIETLIRMVDEQDGMTIIPELAARYLGKEQKKRIRPFSDPAPVREVSLVTRKHFFREKIIQAFSDQCRKILPETMFHNELKVKRIDIDIN